MSGQALEANVAEGVQDLGAARERESQLCKRGRDRAARGLGIKPEYQKPANERFPPPRHKGKLPSYGNGHLLSIPGQSLVPDPIFGGRKNPGNLY